MSERERQQREQEELPPGRQVSALRIVPDTRILEEMLNKLIAQPRIAESLLKITDIEAERVVYEKAWHLYRMMVSPLLSGTISTITVINKKTLRASLRMALNVLSAQAKNISTAYKSDVENALTLLRSIPSAEDAAKLEAILMDKVYTFIAFFIALVMALKTLEGVLNVNLPFHLQSDMIRKFFGYTATS